MCSVEHVAFDIVQCELYKFDGVDKFIRECNVTHQRIIGVDSRRYTMTI